MRSVGAMVVALFVLAGGTVSSAQSGAEVVMRTAASFALERLPTGTVVIDSHRTVAGEDRTIAARLATAVGADTGSLEAVRVCVDVLDPSTCRLEGADVVLAISQPAIRDGQADVRVYAWFAQDSRREPVGRLTLNLRLTRDGGGWRVTAERPGAR